MGFDKNSQRILMMDNTELANLLGWCALVNYSLLLLWFFKEQPEEINNMLSMIYFDNFWNRWFNDNQLILNIYFNFK